MIVADLSRIFEVLSITPIPNAGSLKASVTVRIWGITVRGVKIITAANGNVFVSWPQIPLRDNNYMQVIRVNDRLLEKRIMDLILDEWKKEGATPPSVPTPDDCFSDPFSSI